LWDRLGELSFRFPIVPYALAAFIASGLLLMCHKHLNYYQDYARYLNEVHKSIGLYLETNARPTDVVAARYIGHTGYYSKLKVLDRDGMVTPEAAAYNRQGNYIGFILEFKPEWVVAAPTREGDTFASGREFLQHYHLVKTFGWDESVNHSLYRRSN
ncbi:MAG: hypothetical protein ACREBV_02115, partial [Candidatus Zixiibacteriota bacterium]